MAKRLDDSFNKRLDDLLTKRLAAPICDGSARTSVFLRTRSQNCGAFAPQ